MLELRVTAEGDVGWRVILGGHPHPSEPPRPRARACAGTGASITCDADPMPPLSGTACERSERLEPRLGHGSHGAACAAYVASGWANSSRRGSWIPAVSRRERRTRPTGAVRCVRELLLRSRRAGDCSVATGRDVARRRDDRTPARPQGAGLILDRSQSRCLISPPARFRTSRRGGRLRSARRVASNGPSSGRDSARTPRRPSARQQAAAVRPGRWSCPRS